MQEAFIMMGITYKNMWKDLEAPEHTQKYK